MRMRMRRLLPEAVSPCQRPDRAEQGRDEPSAAPVRSGGTGDMWATGTLVPGRGWHLCLPCAWLREMPAGLGASCLLCGRGVLQHWQRLRAFVTAQCHRDVLSTPGGNPSVAAKS